jgi:hypothetical protein
VWGPRDGSGLNAVDTKRMQDELFAMISERVEDKLREQQQQKQEEEKAVAEETIPVDDEQGDEEDAEEEGEDEDEKKKEEEEEKKQKEKEEKKKQQQLKELAQMARDARKSFNEGWDDMEDVGLMNEVVNAETQIWFMLQHRVPRVVFLLDSNEKIMMKKIRLLRRHPCTSICFANVVGSVLVNNQQSKPTSRTSRAMMQRTSVETALQFQTFIQILANSQAELVQALKSEEKYTIDYHHLNTF